MFYQNQAPYPTPMVERPNINYGKLLLQDYAGNTSEDIATHQYLYHSFILNDQYPDLADALKRISIVEMHHLELLAETIKQLGVFPVFGTFKSDNLLRFTDLGEVDYQNQVKQILEADIKSEQVAIFNYEQRLRQISDRYIQNLLQRIILDEKIHLNIFQNFYQEIVMKKSRP